MKISVRTTKRSRTAQLQARIDQLEKQLHTLNTASPDSLWYPVYEQEWDGWAEDVDMQYQHVITDGTQEIGVEAAGDAEKLCALINALRWELKDARTAVDLLLNLVDHHVDPASIPNGITDPTGSIDEGEVLFREMRNRALWLARFEQQPVSVYREQQHRDELSMMVEQLIASGVTHDHQLIERIRERLR